VSLRASMGKLNFRCVWIMTTNRVRQIRTGVLVQSLSELVKGRGHLQTKKEKPDKRSTKVTREKHTVTCLWKLYNIYK
jgi:hypothetical protein